MWLPFPRNNTWMEKFAYWILISAFKVSLGEILEIWKLPFLIISIGQYLNYNVYSYKKSLSKMRCTHPEAFYYIFIFSNNEKDQMSQQKGNWFQTPAAAIYEINENPYCSSQKREALKDSFLIKNLVILINSTKTSKGNLV